MNRSELRGQVEDYGFQDRTADINSWLSQALQDVYSAARWPWLEKIAAATVSAGNPSVGLPEDFDRAELFILGGRHIGRLSRADFAAYKTSGMATTGTPTHYTRVGNQLRLFPTPTAGGAGELWYYRTATGLDDDDAEPEFPARYHHILIWGALSRGYDQDDQSDQADEARKSFDTLLERMVADLTDDGDDRSESLPGELALAVMRQEVRGYGFDLSNTVIDGLLNDAYFEVCSEVPWKFLKAGPAAITASAGNPTVSLPADCAHIDAVLLNGERLPHEELAAAVYTSGQGASNGTPYQWADWGYADGVPQLRLYPAPAADTTLQVLYTRQPARLVSATDKPVFPVRHHRVLVQGAAARAAEMDPKSAANRVAALRASFEGRLEQMRSDLGQVQLDSPARVVSPAEGLDDGWGY